MDLHKVNKGSQDNVDSYVKHLDTPAGCPSHGSSGSDAQYFRAINQQMPCIGKGLYISGVSAVTNRKTLESQKITHVLNLARELANTEFPDNVNVYCVALRDSEEEDLLKWLPELVQYIHKVISGGGCIVVNCVAGVSRSASVCLAYKVCYEGLTLRQAYDEVYAARPVIAPNLSFWRDLIEWEMEVRGQTSVTLKPHICGMVPELDNYEQYAVMRIKLGWMEDLITMWTFHLLLFFLQVLSIVWV